jgi:anti-sigma regulatory factor (Ser/Thr protein kinase)
MARKQDPEVREFILQNVEENPDSVSSLAVKRFGLTRASIARYMGRLIEEGALTAVGNTRARRYSLKPLVLERMRFDLSATMNEDTIWRERVRPLMKDVQPNIIDLFQYGVTEMVNNVIDHSESLSLTIRYKQLYNRIEVVVNDNGVGIFNKIQRDFNLVDARTALLELSKGKLTSDKIRHSGEGIYFTSRMFDKFSILSGHLYYSRTRQEGDEWLIESVDKDDNSKGTYVKMTIGTKAQWTMREVFDKYQGDDIYFRRTHVPVALGRYPGEQLISRSQAKRILARFNDFAEIMLDFRNVSEIGQPFADEIFRVYRNGHPGTRIMTFNTNANIDKMIQYVQSNGDGSRSPEASS